MTPVSSHRLLKLLSIVTFAAALGIYLHLSHESDREPSVPQAPEEITTHALPQNIQAPSAESSPPSTLEGTPFTFATAPLLDRIERQTIATLHDSTEKQGLRATRTRILETSGTHQLIRLVERSEYRPTTQSFKHLPPLLSVANQFILSATPETSVDDLSTLAATTGATLNPINESELLFRLIFPENSDLASLPETANTLATFPDFVEWIEPDYLISTAAIYPNDPLFAQQSALHQTISPLGQNHDIDAPEAWSIASSANNIVIAVVDSGIHLTHEDLAANIWKNPHETSNGVDDDGNGYIDDIHGINAVDSTGDVSDKNGHGTHVAGIAAAVGNNGKGIAGVAWNAKIMPLRFIGSDGFGSTSDAIECLEYAIENGADIINNSWGGSGKSAALEKTLRKASDAGILIATAAGNEGNDLDEIPEYPAAFEIPNQVVVIAATDNDQLAFYSNSSARLAHIAAPGRVVSSYNENNASYSELAGTSMASPHVAGSLALLKAYLPKASSSQLIARLLNSAEIRTDFAEACVSSGRLNLRRALRGDSNAPENDHFANAINISYSGGLIRGSTSRATKENREPSANLTALGHSVWYRWQPGYAQRGIATLAPVGFSGAIAAYQGNALGSLTRIAAADSVLTGESVSLQIDFQPNKTYYLLVDTNGPGDGPFSLDLALTPSNDKFASAETLDSGNFSEQGSNRAATSERGESPLHPSAAGATVWYKWYANTSGTYFLQLNNPSGRLFARVFNGDSLTNLQPVPATFEPHSEANQLFEATASQTYYFAVDSLSPLGNAYRIEGSYLGEPKLVSQPSDQIVPLGDPALFTVSTFGLGEPVVQWLKDGNPIPNSNATTFRIDSVTEQDLGLYQARVSISGYTLYSREAKLTKQGTALTFLKQPIAMSLVSGETIELSALQANPSPQDSYQWLKDNKPLPGKTSPRLSIPSASQDHSGFYQLQITRDNAIALSRTAYVLVSKDSQHNGFAFTNRPFAMVAHYVFEVVGDTFLSYEPNRIGFSKDGIGWQFAQIGANQIIKANDYFICGNNDGVLRSKDLVNWEKIGTLDSEVYSVAFGNNTYLARTRTAIYRSTNGTTWEKSIDITHDNFGEVAFGNGLFIATSSGALRLSTDGITWRQVSNPAKEWRKAKYADGYWWFYSRWEMKQLYRSLDGENWETLDLPVDLVRYVGFDPIDDRVYFIGQVNDKNDDWNSRAHTYAYRIRGDEVEQLSHIDYEYTPYVPPIAIKAGKVLMGFDRAVTFLEDYQPEYVYNSPYLWSKAPELSYVNNQFIAYGSNELQTSTDGTNWNTIASKNDEIPYGKFAYGNGYYVGYNHHGPSLAALKAHHQSFNSVAFGGGVFVGLNYSGIYYSTNGQTWDLADASIVNAAYLVYGGGAFIAYNEDAVYRSTNGIEWSKVSKGEFAAGYSCIIYGENTFYAFDSNQCYTSTDGRSWTPRGKLEIEGHSSSWIYNAFYFQNKVLVPYWDDYFFESVNGDDWTMKKVTAFSFGYDHRSTYSTDGNILIASTPIGMGILGKPQATPIDISIPKSSRKLTANIGSHVEIDFVAQSLQSQIASISVFVGGSLWKTLPASQRSFSYPISQVGDFNIDIQITDTNGNASSASLLVAATPLVHTTLPKGETWFYDITYWRGSYYATADGGRIYTSTDGVSWKGIQTPTVSRLSNIEGNDRAIVAAIKGSGILYSENGTHWILVESFLSDHLQKSGDIFISGSDYDPHVSLDGKNWTHLEVGSPFEPDAAFANQETFLVSGPNMPAFVVTPHKPVTRLHNLNFAAKSGDNYLALESYHPYRSEDLNTWIPIELNDDYFQSFKKVGDLVFTLTSTAATHVTGNGVDWFEIAAPIGTGIEYGPDGYYYSDMYVQNQDFEIAYYIARSRDGIEWTPFGPPLQTQGYTFGFDGICPSEKGVAAYSSDEGGYLFVTEDSLKAVNGFDSFGFRDEIKVIGDSKKLALTDYHSYYQDQKGSWLRANTRVEETTAYANGFYIGNWHHGPVISKDGENWTDLTLPAWLKDFVDYPDIDSLFTEGDDAIWIKVRTNNNDYSYHYLRTTNGKTWTNIPLPEAADSTSQLFKFKNFVYVGSNDASNGAFLRSDDLFKTSEPIFPVSYWYIQTAATEETLAVMNGEGNGYTTINLSSDGKSFTNHPLPEAGYVNLHATTNAFYLIGDSVWKSTDGKDWTLYLPYRLSATTNRDKIYFYLDNLCFIEKVDTDLAIQSATLPAGDFSIGDSIPIELTLKNAGSKAIVWPKNARIRYTFHSRPNHWSSCAQLPSFSESVIIPTTSLDPTGTKSFTINSRIPEGTPPGSYFLSAYIENEVLSQDGNPSNDFFYQTNVASTTLPARTLTIASSDNGYVESPNKRVYAKGEKILLNAVPDFGYQFAGWSGDAEYGEEALLVTLTENMSVAPSFARRQFTLNLDIDGNGSVSGMPQSGTLTFGESLQLEATPEEGWTFVGWQGYGNSSSRTLNATVGRDLKLQARFGRLYQAWADEKYGDQSDRKAATAPSPISTIPNFEYFSLGLDYQSQIENFPLGAAREGNYLVIRYSLYRGLIDFEVTPVWSEDGKTWHTSRVSTSRISETEDLTLNLARIALPVGANPLFVALRITETPLIEE